MLLHLVQFLSSALSRNWKVHRFQASISFVCFHFVMAFYTFLFIAQIFYQTRPIRMSLLDVTLFEL